MTEPGEGPRRLFQHHGKASEDVQRTTKMIVTALREVYDPSVMIWGDDGRGVVIMREGQRPVAFTITEVSDHNLGEAMRILNLRVEGRTGG